MEKYDIIVVGMGIMGGAAAYQAARRGLKVLGLEQFDQIGHAMGSSHGETRVIRQAYYEHPDYVPLVQDAWNEWKELERLTRQSILVQTGGLMMGLPSSEVVRGAIAAAVAHQLPYEIWDATQVMRRFPAFHVTAEEVAVWEPMAGYIKAEASLLAMVSFATSRGATIHTGENVLAMTSQSPNEVEITTNKDRYSAGAVILTVGPWATRWFPAWPLAVERQVPFWFDGPKLRAMTQYPIYIHENRQGQHTYGFPYIDGQGLKIARHHGGEISTIDTVQRKVVQDDKAALESTLDFLPDVLTSSVCREEVCLYTNSPDSHFIIGRHPQYHGHVIVGAGFSGHGFKFAPTIGRLLLDLAQNLHADELPLFSPLRNAIQLH